MSDKPVGTIIRERLSILQNEVTSLLDRKVPTGEYNVSLRQLYSRIELLALDIEEKKFDSEGGIELSESLVVEVAAKCEELKKNLSLIAIKRPWKWWSIIDFSYRFIGRTMGIGGKKSS
jgi:hypothetical protein